MKIENNTQLFDLPKSALDQMDGELYELLAKHLFIESPRTVIDSHSWWPLTVGELKKELSLRMQYVITKDSYGGAYVLGFKNGVVEVGSDQRHDIEQAWQFPTKEEAEDWAEEANLDISAYGDYTIEKID